MGHKVHPVGFRLGVIRDWQAKWYADKHYAEFLREDLKLRKAVQDKYAEASVSLVEIERQANQVSVTIHTARPGIVIGRGGQRVDETRHYLEQLVGKRIQLNIKEIPQPELDAHLVAKTIAEQIERRIAYRRAMKQVMLRTMQAGARGMKVRCAGRLGGAEIARSLSMHEGQVPLHTLRADIDYGFVEARTMMGRIGIKVWIYKGEILPELKVAGAEAEETPVAEVKAEEPAAGEVEKEVAKPVRRRARAAAPPQVEEIPVAATAEVGVAVPAAGEVEKEVAKPVRRRTRAAAPPQVEEVPVAATAEVGMAVPAAGEVEKEATKPAVRKRTRKVAKVEEIPAAAVAEVSTEGESSSEPGESHVAT